MSQADHTEASYSASEAAARAGLSRKGLLSWEHRYGFPKPVRNERGHRRYTAAEISDLARVRASVDRGESVVAAIAELRTPGIDSQPERSALPAPLLRNVLDSLPIMLAVIQAPDYRYVYVNPALSRAVPEIRIGGRFESVVGSDERVAALERVIRTGEPLYHREAQIVVNGELRYFDGALVRLAPVRGQPHHVLSIGYDTTEAVKAKRDAARNGRLPQADMASRFLQTVAIASRLIDQDRRKMLDQLVNRLAGDLDADGVAIAEATFTGIVPKATASTRLLRWHGFSPESSEVLMRSLERDRLAWLHASKVRTREERALLRRVVARTLCCAPIVLDGHLREVLLLRWSLAERQPIPAEVKHIEVARTLLKLSLRDDGKTH
jgi:DNA-binding transcriptional MerR regulator